MTREGTLLGGQVLYHQPVQGFRSGIEPVLLAASVPARPGERVLEAGTGAAAALLCLAARIPGIMATGVELDPDMARLAAANAAANNFGQIRIAVGMIETVPLEGPYDHAIANPPYHQPDGPASPDPGRRIAKQGSPALIETWVHRLAALLRDRGSLTLILTAGMVPAVLQAMHQARCPCSAIFPLWPKAGRPAKLVVLRGVRHGRMAMRLMPGLVLHRPDGSFTDSARALLESPAPLTLDDQISSAFG